MKLTPEIWALAFAFNCTTLFGTSDRKKYGVRLALVFSLCLASLPLVHAQQYMKGLPTTVTDAKFDEWVKKHELVKCRAIAQAAYPNGPKEIMNVIPQPSGVCYWDIDRAAEIAPPALVVHAGTRIVVRIGHLRPNESVMPAVVFAKVIPPSPGNDVLKNAVNPLQTITLTPVSHANAYAVTGFRSSCDTTSTSFDTTAADDCQEQLIANINSIQASVNHATAALACLESYQVAVRSVPQEQLVPKPTDAYTCTPLKMINPDQPDTTKSDSFAYQKNEVVIPVIQNAMAALMPTLITFSKLDAFMSSSDKNKNTYASQIARDGEIKNAMGAIQTAQATLQQAYLALLSIPDSVPNVFYYFDIPHLTTATVTITGTELVSKTSSTIATWTASATSYNIVFSAGLGFSNLVYRTYASTPQVVNGVPVLNGSGNALSKVTETDTNLSVMAPEIMGSYVIPHLRKFDSACSFGCSLLVSGGIGANLTAKQADFDTGISLRLMDFMITPAVHFGHESRLIDGITVGSQLGANAPSTLPTHNKGVWKFGIVFTYVIPLT